MATEAREIFDRETLLDLTVNVVPLVIIGFFVVAFALVQPFGVDPFASGLQFLLLLVPFVLLALLTYLAGYAIASTEDESDDRLPGQTEVPGQDATSLEGHETPELAPDDGDGATEEDADADAAEADADAGDKSA
jgi:hypothetical protein